MTDGQFKVAVELQGFKKPNGGASLQAEVVGLEGVTATASIDTDSGFEMNVKGDKDAMGEVGSLIDIASTVAADFVPKPKP